MTTDTPYPEENGQIERELELWADVYSALDSIGSLLEPLHAALVAADEAGYFVESDQDRATDIDICLKYAFEEIDSMGDDDSKQMVEWIIDASQAASQLRRGLDQEVKEFKLPEWVNSGEYNTLGEYASYVDDKVSSLEQTAMDWHEIEQS